jgi:hypothetical protein
VKTVASAEFGEEYVANIVRNALGSLAHLGGHHNGPQLAMAPYGPPIAPPGRELLLTWKWNEDTHRPSVHVRVVEMPGPDLDAMRQAEDDRQVKIAMRVAKGFKKI